MKRIILTGLAALVVLSAAATAFAGDTAMPGAERRQQIQKDRIRQGVASGQLTPRETIRLEKEQAGIERTQRRMEADGAVTPRERARLHMRQDKASGDIDRARHNRKQAR